MVEIRIYGRLRKDVQDCGGSPSCVILAEACRDETVASILAQVGIPIGEVNHVFVNAKLLASRSKAASFMGYPQARSNLSDWDLNLPVEAGDRIGVFGPDMALVGM